MMKTPSNGVLGSSKSSTYPRGYVSGFDSPAALLYGVLIILRDWIRWLSMKEEGGYVHYREDHEEAA
jgi:hypothetical protein